MAAKSPAPPQPTPLLPSAIPLLGLLLLFPLPSNGDNGCQTSPSCGESRDVPYPFWIYDETFPSHICGYPGFMLVCKNNSTLIFPLGSDDYQVLRIDPASRTISLTDADVLSAPSGCPRVRHNLSFVFHAPPIPTHDDLAQYFDPVLEYAPSDANLTFFFNCTHGSTFNPLEEIACLAGSLDGNKSYILIGDTIPYEFDSVSCSDIVVAPVLQGELNQSATGIANSYGEVLRSGFELNWPEVSRSNNCGDCERSEGLCGMNRTSDSACAFACFCNNGSIEKYKCVGPNMPKKKAIGIITGAALAFLFLLCLLFPFILRCRKNHTENDRAVETFLRQYGSLAPKRYTYSEIKVMTKSFSNKLGQGGYGSVFKGALRDGYSVAVKVLNESKGDGQEFINEVASISRTSHVNIVSLLGFCLDGSKRALAYEFMPNGSLDKFIYADRSKLELQLDWTKLYEIAVGIARGLEYLHRGCNTRIVHFDIEPHNILLDEDLRPKISDFGLSKLCPQKESKISMTAARGTPGYIAPELVIMNIGAISSKSDVYSYGMMLMEMVRGRKKIDAAYGLENTSDIYFPEWIYDNLEKYYNLIISGVTDDTQEKAKNMIIVGLWCIQIKPENRPTMSMVVDMLDGSNRGLQMPPRHNIIF